MYSSSHIVCQLNFALGVVVLHFLLYILLLSFFFSISCRHARLEAVQALERRGLLDAGRILLLILRFRLLTSSLIVVSISTNHSSQRRRGTVLIRQCVIHGHGTIVIFPWGP